MCMHVEGKVVNYYIMRFCRCACIVIALQQIFNSLDTATKMKFFNLQFLIQINCNNTRIPEIYTI